ncbi:MAG: hypothetical protein QOE82_2046 [Thermoanaerobaculia bacterium]|nr:hypothetical protein [Thermoanaerobaculia bacterium]
MSNGIRRSLFILSASMLLMFAVSASAQQYCDECDPYSSYCSDPCLKCHIWGQDGCVSYTESTCGGRFNSDCIPDECTPSWSETSRVTQGTYDGNSWNGCNHHSVQWVTLYDANECNTNSYFWTQHYCDDVIDGHKNGFYPDCCDGYGPYGPDPLYTCNGYHSCTG